MNLRTERLELEPVSVANAVTMWNLMQEPYLREFQDVPRYGCSEFIKRVRERPARFNGRSSGRFEWIIQPIGWNGPVGWVSLRIGEGGRAIAEIGYTLRVEGRGLGFATESVGRIIEFAFAEAGLTRIEACCVPENLSSRRLLDRIGFKFSRRQRNGAVVAGRPVDVMIYSVARRQWRAQASSAKAMEMPASANP